MDQITSLSVPHELSKSDREEIVAHLDHFAASGTNVWEKRFFEYTLPGRPKLFLKLEHDAVAEASTQHFFYLRSQADESAPRIAKVFDAFYALPCYHILVMEKIDAPTLGDSGLPEEEMVKHAASAVGWLLNQLPSVPSACFGRIASDAKAVAKHHFFNDSEAPKPFSGPEDLARYLARASRLSCLKEKRRSADEIMELMGAGRRIYHSDIKKDNFLLDANGTVYIIDFHHIGVLPEVFQTLSFFNSRGPFAEKVGRQLGLIPSSSAKEIAAISGIIRQLGGSANFSMEFTGLSLDQS